MSDEEKNINQEEPIIANVDETQKPTNDNKEVENTSTEEVKAEGTPKEETLDAPSALSDDAPKLEEPTLIDDNTVEPPTAPIQDLPRTIKIKEPMSKNKKIAIIVISVIAFIALFSVVFFPVYFCYVQGRIHVYDAEDFVPEDGKRFVLEKDITIEGDLALAGSTCSIDLNGHNLTVTGSLSLGKDGTTINIGKLKKGEYTADGLVNAGSLIVDASNAIINIPATLIVKNSMSINAKDVTLNNLSIVGTTNNISAKALTVNGPFTASSDSTGLTITNCEKATFNGELGIANVITTNSNVVLSNGVTAKNFALDDTSTLVVYGSINSIQGGSKVAMMKGHTCSGYTGIKTLAIYNAFDQTFSAVDCDKIIYLETLATPVDFIVSEEGGVFKAVCSQVDSYTDVSYKFIMDSKEYDVTHDNFVDITADLKAAGAATHYLQAYALGNFNFETLNPDELTSGQTLYLDCETPATLEYSYTLKLATPKNVCMNEYEAQTYILFDSVEFADYYVVTIDGTTQVVLTSLNKDDFISVHSTVAAQYGNNIVQYKTQFGQNGANLTEQLSSLGYHSLRLVASSFSKEIEASKDAMTSYKTEKEISITLENISAISVLSEGKYVNTITISNCPEAKIISITIGDETIRLSGSNTYTFVSDESLVGTKISVTAEAYQFYTEKTISDVVFTAA